MSSTETSRDEFGVYRQSSPAIILVAACLVAVAFASEISAATLGHWSFSETSGGTASDSSGNGNHGTLNNFDTGLLAGDLGTSGWMTGGRLKFDGTNDFITTPVATSAMQANFTLEAVVTYAGAANRTWTPIFGSTQNPFSGAQIFYFGKRDGNTDFHMNIGGLTGGTNIAGTNLFDGNKHHLAVAFDNAANQLLVYVDHALHTTVSGITGTPTYTMPMIIGGSGHATGERWIGSMDAVRVSDSVLTPGQFMAVPEPSTWAMLCLGIAWLGVVRLRRLSSVALSSNVCQC